ncbi:MAG: glycosyltransferase [Bacteroidota bacterium]
MKISVILPTYNERVSICQLITEILKILSDELYEYELIIVDDNSPDGTYRVILDEFSDNSMVVPILRVGESGLASAILHGIRVSSGDTLVVMDTDFNHPPNLIPLLVKITDYFEIAVGSRYVIGGGMETSRMRFLGSKIFNKFIKYTLGVKTTDNLSGFFAFKKSILDGIKLESIFYGYGDYFIRFLYVMQKRKRFILEIPVVYKDRIGGLSKTDLKKELLRYSKTVLRIRFSKNKYS